MISKVFFLSDYETHTWKISFLDWCLYCSFNPFTPTSDQSKNMTKFLNFILQGAEKQLVPCESTAKEVSFEWSHNRNSSTDSKVRTSLYSIINSTAGKHCSVAFIWMVTAEIQKLEPPYKFPSFKRFKKVFLIRSWYSQNTYNLLTFNTILGCMPVQKNLCVD